MDSTSPYAPLCQKVKKEINKRQKKECVETNTSVAQPLIHARTLSSQKHVLLFVPWDENCRSGAAGEQQQLQHSPCYAGTMPALYAAVLCSY